MEPEAFSQAIASGEVVLDGPAARSQQRETARKKYLDALAYLQSLPNPSPTVAALLAQVASADAATLTRQNDFALPNGSTVRLLSLADQVLKTANAQRRARSPENAIQTYRMLYETLPEGEKGGLPTSDSMQGQGIEAIKSALQQLQKRMAQVPRSSARLESSAVAPPRSAPLSATPAPESTADVGDGEPCTRPRLFQRFWFPLKHFLSPMKHQGNRGTCWAFAAVGALESRERVQYDNLADLSEQFFVHHDKWVNGLTLHGDGGDADKALNDAREDDQGIPSETAWPYNRSSERIDVDETYSKSCTRYAITVFPCSDTSHQGERVFSQGPLGATYLGYKHFDAPGPLVPAGADDTNMLWVSGDPFDVPLLVEILAMGHVLMSNFPVYVGFDNPVDGFVTDYTSKSGRAKKGYHAALLVGFISNEELAALGRTEQGDGGGFFILKNSWGCNSMWGDQGYGYVPATYVEMHFDSISTLVFRNSPRGNRWQQEAANPGSTEAPEIEVLVQPPSALKADVRVPDFNIEQLFRVTHSTAAVVQFKVISDLQGTVYEGPLTTGKGMFPNPVKVNFTVLGLHNLTATASYGTAPPASAEGRAIAVNTEPAASVETMGAVYAGEPHPFFVVPTDINEPDPSKLCAEAYWDSTDANIQGTGCGRILTFPLEGVRQISVGVRDREGRWGYDSLLVQVLPAPANPYPRVVSWSVRAREMIQRGNFSVCDLGEPVVPGATIDLLRNGCQPFGFPGSDPTPQYLATVGVENPSGEMLTYEWKLYATQINGELTLLAPAPSSSQTFTLTGSNFNAFQAERPCKVEVAINAPEPARSKSVRVWQGRCISRFGTVN